MAPIKRSDGTIISWLAVKQMRFLNLHRDNLLMLQAFLGYFADGVYSGQLSEKMLHHFPECPVPFARELTRLTRLQQELGLESQLVLLRFDLSPVQEQAVGLILKTARGLDEIWYVDGEVEQRLLVLLPFSDDQRCVSDPPGPPRSCARGCNCPHPLPRWRRTTTTPP